MNEEELKEISKAVGHIPSGLFIVCAHDLETKNTDGFLASWIQQVSFDPLRISLCVRPGRPAYDLIKSGSTFSINIVGEHEKNYLKHFWSGYNPEKNPFVEISHTIDNNGAVILNEAKSTIVCKMHEAYKPGDHELIISDVLESHTQNNEAKPMVHIRKSGLDY